MNGAAHRALVVVLAASLQACQSGYPAPHTRIVEAEVRTERDEPASEHIGVAEESHGEEARTPAGLGDEHRTSQPREPCRGWPSDPTDPRAGIYVDDRPGQELREAAWNVLFFDGSTVTVVLEEMGLRALHFMGCEQSDPDEFEAHLRSGPGWRYHAQVDGEGWLFVLYPCRGWTVFGRFVGDGFETRRGVKRRLPDGAMSELYDGSRDARYLDLLFRCYDVYESRARPIPPIPPVPRDVVRDYERARSRRARRH